MKYKSIIIIFMASVMAMALASLVIFNRTRDRNELISIVSKIKHVRKDRQCLYLENHLDEFMRYLEPGMAKDDVAAILGRPHNVDHANVWIWIHHHYYKEKDDNISWVNKGGYFILFINDVLVSKPWPTGSVTPDVLLAHILDTSTAEAWKMLDKLPNDEAPDGQVSE
jgi:outer membrane protein assembly factor BamE (lipoprotein component of BamABCDE complex)